MRGTTTDFINYMRRTTMIDSLRPFLSRLIAPFITAFLAWLAMKFGINFGDDATQHLTEYAVVVLVTVLTAVNSVIHRLIDKKVNPGDAASSHIAVQEKSEAQSLKAG